MGQQRLVFLENVHVPTPLSSSRDAERRAFPTLEKEPLLGVPVDIPKGPSTHFTCGRHEAHEASWPGPSHLSRCKADPGLPEGHAFAVLLHGTGGWQGAANPITPAAGPQDSVHFGSDLASLVKGRL